VARVSAWSVVGICTIAVVSGSAAIWSATSIRGLFA
jgi:hypothetical protein